MDQNMGIAVDLVREGLLVAVKITLPLLLVGLVVGMTISFFQAITQIQEQTLSFVPKMAAVAGALVVMLPWILQILADYTREVVMNMGTTFK